VQRSFFWTNIISPYKKSSSKRELTLWIPTILLQSSVSIALYYIHVHRSFFFWTRGIHLDKSIFLSTGSILVDEEFSSRRGNNFLGMVTIEPMNVLLDNHFWTGNILMKNILLMYIFLMKIILLMRSLLLIRNIFS